MGVKLVVTGRQRLETQLSRIPSRVEDRVQQAVKDAGEELFARVYAETPLAAGPEAGALREGTYLDTSIPGVAEVGNNAPHAPYVHELGITVYPEWSPIGWTTPGTGAKFIERPFLESRNRIIQEIKDAARKGVRP